MEELVRLRGWLDPCCLPIASPQSPSPPTFADVLVPGGCKEGRAMAPLIQQDPALAKPSPSLTITPHPPSGTHHSPSGVGEKSSSFFLRRALVRGPR